jgi:hypothetical protein
MVPLVREPLSVHRSPRLWRTNVQWVTALAEALPHPCAAQSGLLASRAASMVRRNGKVAYDTPRWKQWLADKRAGQDPPLPSAR